MNVFGKVVLDNISNNTAFKVGMARFLLLSTSLRRLQISGLNDDVNRVQLLNAVRQNGSLRHVPGLDAAAIARTMVRNAFIPDIFQYPIVRNALAVAGGQALRCFPTMLKVAQGAPRMAPNALFVGLLATAEDTIGPKLDD
jgi:hypothetical protein